MNLRRICLLTVIFCLLQACSTAPKAPISGSITEKWAQYQLEAGRINSWNLHGRAAIFVDDEVYNIGLRWRRNANEFVIVLEAPFGQGVVRLESSRETSYPVKLSLSDGRVVYAEDVESALLDTVGFAIPLNGLVFWIRGLPMNTMPFSHEMLGDGRLESLSQNDWQINYLDYFDPSEVTEKLPRKMYLKHDKLALKIVIERWQKTLTKGDNNELFPSFNN